jgi:hypothetical protein
MIEKTVPVSGTVFLFFIDEAIFLQNGVCVCILKRRISPRHFILSVQQNPKRHQNNNAQHSRHRGIENI